MGECLLRYQVPALRWIWVMELALQCRESLINLIEVINRSPLHQIMSEMLQEIPVYVCNSFVRDLTFQDPSITCPSQLPVRPPQIDDHLRI